MIAPLNTATIPGLNITPGGNVGQTGGTGQPGSTTGLGSSGQTGGVPTSGKATVTGSGGDFSPPGPAPTSIDPQAASQQLSAVQSFLTLAKGLNEVGELFIKFANEQQKDALNQRLQSRQTAKDELMSQASQMDKSAQDIRSSAIASLVLTVVSAAVSIAMAGMSMRGTADAAGSLKEVNVPGEKVGTGEVGLPKTEFDLEETESISSVEKTATENMQFQKDMQAIGVKNQQAQNWGTMGQTVGQLGQGVAGFASSEGQAESKEAEAEGSRDAALSQDASAQEDIGKSLMEQAQQLVQQIIGLLKELGDAKAQQMQSLTRV